jgi:hypothetical protein
MGSGLKKFPECDNILKCVIQRGVLRCQQLAAFKTSLQREFLLLGSSLLSVSSLFLLLALQNFLEMRKKLVDRVGGDNDKRSKILIASKTVQYE